jgi:hypothetical protein
LNGLSTTVLKRTVHDLNVVNLAYKSSSRQLNTDSMNTMASTQSTPNLAKSTDAADARSGLTSGHAGEANPSQQRQRLVEHIQHLSTVLPTTVFETVLSDNVQRSTNRQEREISSPTSASSATPRSSLGSPRSLLREDIESDGSEFDVDSTEATFGEEEDEDEDEHLSQRHRTVHVRAIVSSDLSVLRVLYKRTGGQHWMNNGGWIDSDSGTEVDGCSWYGVTCDNAGHVTGLFLRDNNLTGVLPSQLGTLEKLLYLRLNGNLHLSGTIPTELGSLSLLSTFDLYQCALSGTIPSELGNLTAVTYFAVSQNQLTGT